jgi:vacuolar-type H+-ATPase subunit I/STV1
MPRLFHRIIKNKTSEDLSLLIENLFSYVEKTGGLDSFDKIEKKSLENLFSYYKKINAITQEEINILWESASHFTSELLNRKAIDVIEKEKRDNKIEEKKILYGKYWIIPAKGGKSRKYLKCDNYVNFCRENGDIFIESLGIDSFDYLHALHSNEKDVVSLILSAGGIMGEFIFEGDQKVGNFQLSQCALPWLKKKLVKMPIFKSHIRVVNPHEEYKSEKDGIYFIFRRPVSSTAK